MINWGIIGFGRMGKTFADCFKNSNESFKLTAIASTSNSKISFEDKNLNVFKNYDELILSPKIDAIYVATLNNTHKEIVVKGLNNNKKILCEKPLGMNVYEVDEIYKHIKEKKNIFFEAIAYRSHPQLVKLFEILKDKKIGKIKKIEANFGFKLRKINKDSRLFNKDLGGGSILDLGCYPISFFNLFAINYSEIKIIKSSYNLCETNVDINGEIHLKLNNEIDAIGKVSLSENLENICRLYCENAIITVPNPWLPPEKSFLEIETKQGYFKEFINTNKNIYEHQLYEVNSFFCGKNAKNSHLVNIEESLEISRILDKWLK